MPLIVSGPWKAHLTMALRNQTPTTSLRHQGGFLLVRFLWPFKENELVCPDETGHQNTARASDSS